VPVGCLPARFRSAPEVVLSTIVAILLGVFWLGVLVTVGFTAWRLLANLKSLLRSVTELNERLTPTLEDLADKGQEAAELAARLQERQLGRGGAAAPRRRRR
jgi:hypothetical protein